MELYYKNLVSEVFTPSKNEITIKIPDELVSKQIELIILPFDNYTPQKANRKLELSTYKCKGKLTNFTREDAYKKTL